MTDLRRAVLGCLVACLVGGNLLSRPAEEIKGRIKSLSLEKRQLVLTDDKDTDRSFVLAADVKFFHFEEERPFDELAEGFPVTVTYEKRGEQLVATRITLKAFLMRRDNYALVRVFYGTDRRPGEESDRDWWWYAERFSATGLAGAVTLLAGVLAFVRRRWFAKLVFLLGMVTTLALGAWTVQQSLVEASKPVSAAASYGNDRGRQVAVGTCTVSIPLDHRMGELESPSLLRLEFRQNPAKHVVLQKIEPRPDDEFYALLRECVERSERREAFVFVHGYNVSFEDAARRTAQLAYDLEFEGAPLFYSWPSQAGLLRYAVDETNAEWSVPHLRSFLHDLAARSGARRIHLVAHSMGNRALTGALRALAADPSADTSLFHEVVLAAPDIDAEVFKRDIVPALQKAARRVTLYASSHDQALAASKQLHGYPRAGESGPSIVVVPGLDTVDVSAVDTSFLGHSYYGDNQSLIADLIHVFKRGLPPERRERLRPRPYGPLKYWFFEPGAPTDLGEDFR